MRSLINSLAIVGMLAFVGCGSESTDEAVDFEKATTAETPDHSHEGPNGGEVIEFTDDHAYHLEVCMDETSRDVTAYIYGANLETTAIAEEIEFEIDNEDGDEVEIEAVAKPRDGEEGGASVFTIAGAGVPESAKDLHDFHWHMHIKIAGTEYEAELPHDDAHDHDHGHDHEGHADHGKEGEHKEGPSLGAPNGEHEGHHDEDHKDGDHGHKEDGHHEADHKESDGHGHDKDGDHDHEEKK